MSIFYTDFKGLKLVFVMKMNTILPPPFSVHIGYVYLQQADTEFLWQGNLRHHVFLLPDHRPVHYLFRYGSDLILQSSGLGKKTDLTRLG